MQRHSHKNGFIKANGTTQGAPLLVEEAYSGELVNEYTYNGKKEKPKKRSVRHQIHNARALFSELFMPQGYPGTVSPDYLEYQKWDTLQAFASSQNGALATMAVLKGVGVGNENAIVLAAALTWLLKDGAGMIARILFSWSRGSRLDSDNKRWRLVADLLSDASFSLELLSSYLPQLFFAPICCFVAFLRAIVDVSGRTTRMAVMRHQARRDNLADVAAKDNSQETLVHVFSLLTSLILLPAVDGNVLLIWLCSFLFSYVHLYSNYRAVKSLEFDILNQARFQIAVRHFLDFGSAPSVQWCNAQEPILVKMSHGLRHLNLGCPMGSLPFGLDVPKILSAKFDESGQFDGLIWKWTGKAICVIDGQDGDGDGGTAWMALGEDATNEDIFDSLFAISHFGEGKGWPSTARIEAFRKEMAGQGWSLQTNQLNIDDWRFSHKKDRKTG